MHISSTDLKNFILDKYTVVTIGPNAEKFNTVSNDHGYT